MEPFYNTLALSGSVGNNFTNQEEDVFAVKKVLSKRGFYNKPVENGIIDSESTKAIKEFQKYKNLKVDGILMPNGETEAAINSDIGYENRDMARRNQIINNLNDFNINIPAVRFPKDTWDYVEDEVNSWGHKQLEIPSFSPVNQYSNIIERKSQEFGADPKLVKAIMRIENTRGWYDEAKARFDKENSIRPMNVRPDIWRQLGYTRNDLKYNTEKNIEAGVRIIKGISDRVPDKNIEKISTLYQNLGADFVSQYGQRVKEFYDTEPWKYNE